MNGADDFRFGLGCAVPVEDLVPFDALAEIVARAVQAFPESPSIVGDDIQNGTGLFRSYCYYPLESGVIIPDFGGTDFRSYTIALADLRDPLIAYTESSNEPTSWTLTFDSLSPSGGSASLPASQRNPYDSGLGPTFMNFDTCYRYAIPTLTVKPGPIVGLDFDLEITGGYSQTGTIEFVKDSLVSQSEWDVTPRTYEMLLKFTFQTNLP